MIKIDSVDKVMHNAMVLTVESAVFSATGSNDMAVSEALRMTVSLEAVDEALIRAVGKTVRRDR